MPSQAEQEGAHKFQPARSEGKEGSKQAKAEQVFIVASVIFVVWMFELSKHHIYPNIHTESTA
jgi:hypothetical protein